MRATCPAHFSRLELRFLILLGEEYNARSSALCNFLYSPIISYILTPTNVSKYFILEHPKPLFLSQRVRPSFKTVQYNRYVIVLYVLTFSFLQSRRDDKIFSSE